MSIQDRNKNTNTGPLFISEYIGISNGVQTVAFGATNAYSPEDYEGCSGARFCLMQIMDDSVGDDLRVEIGISGSVREPNAGSMRIGTNYGTPMIQLPQYRSGVDEPPVVVVAPAGADTVTYNFLFIK